VVDERQGLGRQSSPVDFIRRQSDLTLSNKGLSGEEDIPIVWASARTAGCVPSTRDGVPGVVGYRAFRRNYREPGGPHPDDRGQHWRQHQNQIGLMIRRLALGQIGPGTFGT
jgi:hypothetical protein